MHRRFAPCAVAAARVGPPAAPTLGGSGSAMSSYGGPNSAARAKLWACPRADRRRPPRRIPPREYATRAKCLHRADDARPRRRHDQAMFAKHPRRTLIATLLFVVIAGVVGGPLAGRLSSSGGFVAPGADSQVALERLHAATGRDSGPGLVLLTDRAARDGAAARLARIPGVASVATPAPRLVTGVVQASADDGDVAGAALDAFAGRRDVVVGGSAVADVQVGDTVGEDLGRAELLAFPLLVLLSLLFFRGRAALLPLAAGVTTVLGTFLALSAIN